MTQAHVRMIVQGRTWQCSRSETQSCRSKI